MSFLNFYDLYSLNIAENISFIHKAMEETCSSYSSFFFARPQLPMNIYHECLNKLIMLFCLITHTVLNNTGNDRSIHYDSPSDEQTDIQGRILASCIKLIDYDSNVDDTVLNNF